MADPYNRRYIGVQVKFLLFNLHIMLLLTSACFINTTSLLLDISV